MFTSVHTQLNCQSDFTVIVCEACFDVLLEDDTEYVEGKALCHHCIRENSQ